MCNGKSFSATIAVTASSTENGAGAAANVLDNNMQTRWSSQFSDPQWLLIDMGEDKDIFGLTLHWEAAYAKSYDILLSKDSKEWIKAYATTEGNGSTDDIYFGKKKVRFIKILLKERGTQWGYSLWEVKIKGPEDEIPITASASSKANHPEDAMDGNPETMWWSGKTDKAWLEVEFRKERNLGGIFIGWGEDYATSYKIEASSDKKTWNTIYEHRNGKGGLDKIYVNIRDKRYLKIDCENSNGEKGYSVKEISFKDWEDVARNKSLDKARGLAGWEGSRFKAFIGKDGSFACYPYPFRITFWVYDHQKDLLYTPETMETEWRLIEGGYPVTVVSWKGDGLEAQTTIFSWQDDKLGKVLTYARESVKNTGNKDKEVSIFAVIRPNPLYQKWKVEDVKTIEYDNDHTVKINGAPRIFLDERADGPLGQDQKDSLSYKRKIKAGGTETLDLMVPAGEGRDLNFNEIKDLSFDEALELTIKYWKSRVPLELNLPDKRYSDCFYSSLYYILIMNEQHKLSPGPYEYTSFFLHDAVDMDNALDKAGLTEEARDSTDYFNYTEGGGYVDELGGSLFGLYEHYRLTKDKTYLEAVYPRMKSGCELIKKLRAKQLELPQSDPAYGLLPKGVSQDNFKIPAYLYVDDWWAVVGLKSGWEAAEKLGKKEDVKWIREQYESLLKATVASIEKVMKKEGLKFMPGFADYWPKEMHIVDGDYRILGDAQMAWAHRPALFPGQNMGIPIPIKLFADSYKRYWKNAGKFTDYDGAWFVEYEKVFWGYNFKLAHPLIYLGMEDVALKNIEWGIEHQSCPGGWMEAMPSRKNEKGLYEITEGVIGDVPHGWSAAHYVLLLRDMLLREDGNKLILLSCIPETWLDDGKVIEIKNAPTYFGKVSFKVESFRNKGFLKLTLDAATPPSEGYILIIGKKKISIPANTKETDVKI